MLLDVDNINVYYGAIHAIKGISFHVDEGEIVTLIGANGAGKTTTLNTISGLLRSKTGDVKFRDKSLAHTAPHSIIREGLALVPEGRRIFLQLTVEENLEMGAYTRPKEEVASSLKLVFELFPRLEERRRQIGGTLSGGEQQMLAMPSWWSRCSTSSALSTQPAPRSFLWSRTLGWPCPSPTAPMCSRTDRSLSPVPEKS